MNNLLPWNYFGLVPLASGFARFVLGHSSFGFAVRMARKPIYLPEAPLVGPSGDCNGE
jgi:hypothetical protein